MKDLVNSDPRFDVERFTTEETPKERWLNEQVFVDEYGRPENLSDVPMTHMTRKEAFDKRGYSEETIAALWLELTQYNQKPAMPDIDFEVSAEHQMWKKWNKNNMDEV
jgi:hypothetical protein